MSDIVERLHRGVDTNVPPDKTDSLMAEAADEIERLKVALREARQYVSDAITDEDPETQRHADALIGQIDAALERK